MATQRSINLINVIKEERIILGIAGFYVANNKYRKLQNISAAFLSLLAFLYAVLGTIEIFQNISDIALTAQICSFIFTHYATIGKVINIIYHNKHLLLLEDILRDPLFTEPESLEEERIVYENLKLSMLFKKIFAIQMISCFIFGGLKIIIRQFPLQMWFPFNEYDHFYTIFFIELIISGCSGSICVTIDVLLLSLLDICSAQFTILNNRLLAVGSTREDECIENDILVQKLKKYIKHHSCIYRFADLIQEVFSIGLFLEILSIGAILCFSAFSVLITPVKSTQFVVLALYTQCMIWQIAVHCWFGQKLLNTADQITESCYLSKWYECSLDVQKHILMIMRRSNRTVLITAAGLFSLDLKNLMNILSSAYSYFTIIWQMYGETDMNNEN